jgi:myosin I
VVPLLALQANKDTLSKDLMSVLQTSGDQLIQHLYPSEAGDAADDKKQSSLGAKIRTQCNALVTTLLACQPHYIR